MPRICLSMIVKNETPVIARCLASVRPWIDHWVIVDTGSTDGTQTLVRECTAGLPGTLHERPWRDFAANRNEALELARPHGDLLLFIDADETLQVPDDFAWPDLPADGYQLLCELAGWRYHRNSLVATRLPWRWEGVLHEFLTCDLPHQWATLPAPTIRVTADGARARDPDTYLRDVEVLERALVDQPGNTRYQFYLAQSLRDAGRLEPSRAAYLKRAAMGGWDQECWFSLFQAAVLAERLGDAPMQVVDAYLMAYQFRPSRAEPLVALARYHRLRDEFARAHLVAQQASVIAYPDDILFVDAEAYAWRALDEVAVNAFYVPPARAQGIAALQRLLQEQKFPEAERSRMEGNRVFYGL